MRARSSKQLAAGSIVVAVLLFGALVTNCYAGGSVTGGDSLLDGSIDAGSSDAAEITCLSDANAPATWSGLYTDYFGPTGAATCSHDPKGCHGMPGDPGANATGYICGDSKGDCYASIVMAKNENGVRLVIAGDVDASYLPVVVRKQGEVTNDLRMPLKPATVMFCPTDVDRIRNWIAAGALNN